MNIERQFARLNFSGQKKVRVLRQIQRLIAAGVPVARTLDMLHDLYSRRGKKRGDPIAIAVDEWRSRLREGVPLARCMRGWLSTSEEMIVEAGEQGGNLSTAFSDALEASSVSTSIRKAVIGGVAYPAVMLGVLFFALYGFSTEIVPTFETILPANQWTGNARRMYVIAGFVREWMAIVVAAFGLISALVFFTLPALIGPGRVMLDRLPPWSIYKVIQGASFMLSLRGFLAAGVPVPDALRRMSQAGNPYMRERVNGILDQVNRGRNLGEAMNRTGHHFPDSSINDEITIYAGLDNFTDSLDVLAKEWIHGSIARAQATSKVMSNVMLVLLAMTIAYMARSLFELQDLVTKAAGA